MTVCEYCEMMHHEPTDEQLLACVYAEARGYAFAVDFGFENCERLAEDICHGTAAPPYKEQTQ